MSVLPSNVDGFLDEAKKALEIMRCRKIVFYPILEEGVFRFDSSPNAILSAHPSISFQNSRDRNVPIPNFNKLPTYYPSFKCADGQQTVTMKLPSETSFYGTGEVSGPLERTGTKIVTWNTDAFAYGVKNQSLYQSHPWVLAVLPNGEAFGVLADTTRRCEIDLTEKSVIKFVSSASYPVITFGPFASPTDVIASFARAVGTVFMPPKWSLGYHQSRWSYDRDSKVREIAITFREKAIPCDVIWMDIDYMDGFRSFTFDKEQFPDPKSLADYLHKNGFKANWMLDPGQKKEDGYFVYDSGCENDVWVKTAAGEPFVGNVWPGPCVFPDFTKSSVRLWWTNLVKKFMSNGVDGLWNDMNEPAVWNTDNKTMPEDNIHNGDSELGGPQKHLHYHNVYGMLMAKSSYEGMKLANGQKRPFVLTRAAFVGSQRYAATWTGDNKSTWKHFQMCIPMVVQLGLSGQPLSGPDIGGFAKNASAKLFGRWMGVGAMFPFSRAHSIKGSVDHEPWSFGIECEDVCRRALRRRYRLLPHLYTLCYTAHTKGIPIVTPTFFADLKLRTQENAFLLGPLLVYASTRKNEDLYGKEHKLPNGSRWFNFDFDDIHPDLPALYLKGGSILLVGPPIQHVGEANPTDDLTLLVALDENGKAEGTLFEDDGDGYDYTKGGYLLTKYIAELKDSVVTVSSSNAGGTRKRPKRCLHVQLLLGEGAKIDAWGTDGERLQISMPSESEVAELVRASDAQLKIRLKNAKPIPDDTNPPDSDADEPDSDADPHNPDSDADPDNSDSDDDDDDDDDEDYDSGL